MKRLGLVVALVLAGCGGGEDRFPSVEGAWRVEGDAIVCDGASGVTTEPASGPFTSVMCSWVNVFYAGQNRCSVTVTYERPSVSDPWPAPVVFPTHADCS